MSALVAGYARTPFSRFNGRFASVPAISLGAHAISAAVSRAGVGPAEVQRVIAGHVLQGALARTRPGNPPWRQASR